MTIVPKDPLLAAARLLLAAMIGVLGLVTALLVLALPAVFIFRSDLVSAMAREGIPDGGALIGPIAVIVAGVAVLLAMAVWFLALLRRIVISVGDGDPFVPVNADRLARMGWIALVGQLASMPLAALGVWLLRTVAEHVDTVTADINTGFDFSGLLLILVLFILARVFRHGAAMREDLEGTV